MLLQPRLLEQALTLLVIFSPYSPINDICNFCYYYYNRQMLKKNIIIFSFFLSLLFNIQIGFTHGVEHINHNHHESGLECEDCLLKHNLVKSPDLTNSSNFNFSNHNNHNESYSKNNNIVFSFVAFQSNAP